MITLKRLAQFIGQKSCLKKKLGLQQPLRSTRVKQVGYLGIFKCLISYECKSLQIILTETVSFITYIPYICVCHITGQVIQFQIFICYTNSRCSEINVVEYLWMKICFLPVYSLDTRLCHFQIQTTKKLRKIWRALEAFPLKRMLYKLKLWFRRPTDSCFTTCVGIWQFSNCSFYVYDHSATNLSKSMLLRSWSRLLKRT